MPRFTYEVPVSVKPDLDTLPAQSFLVFDPGNPNYEFAYIRLIRRGSGDRVLAVSDRLRLVAQSPPVYQGADPLADYLELVQPA